MSDLTIFEKLLTFGTFVFLYYLHIIVYVITPPLFFCWLGVNALNAFTWKTWHSFHKNKSYFGFQKIKGTREYSEPRWTQHRHNAFPRSFRYWRPRRSSSKCLFLSRVWRRNFMNTCKRINCLYINWTVWVSYWKVSFFLYLVFIAGIFACLYKTVILYFLVGYKEAVNQKLYFSRMPQLYATRFLFLLSF